MVAMNALGGEGRGLLLDCIGKERVKIAHTSAGMVV